MSLLSAGFILEARCDALLVELFTIKQANYNVSNIGVNQYHSIIVSVDETSFVDNESGLNSNHTGLKLPLLLCIFSWNAEDRVI